MNKKPRTLQTRAFDPDDQLEHQFEEVTDPSRVIRFVASDDTLDRYGEVVLPSGVDFSGFAKNAPLMGHHDYSEWPIGKVVSGEVRENQLWLDAELDSEKDDPEAEKVLRKIRNKTIKTGSIGFIPKRFITPSEGTKSKKDKDLFSQYPDARRIYTDWEIIEFSIVPIPANPNALASKYPEVLIAAYEAFARSPDGRFGTDSLLADLESDAHWSAQQQEEVDDALYREFAKKAEHIIERIKANG